MVFLIASSLLTGTSRGCWKYLSQPGGSPRSFMWLAGSLKTPGRGPVWR